jgi:hypothetical protein
MSRNGVASLAGIALLTAGFAVAGAAHAAERYVAKLRPLNAKALDRSASGTAILAVEGGRLRITVAASGLAPGVMHMQHYHGFPGGQDATCPTPQADANGDGFVDLVETEPMAGTTMVPFNAEPANLEIASDTYPVASKEGTIRYKQTVTIEGLEKALKKRFGTPELVLDKRVVFLHGTAPNTDLPSSVQSLPRVPAQVTLPVACGIIEPAD